jgi:hypothetical protein
MAYVKGELELVKAWRADFGKGEVSTYTEILPILGDIGEVSLCVTSIEP